MTNRKLAAALTIGVAAATVTSAMATGGQPPHGRTVVVQKRKMEFKKAEAKPAAKAFAPMMKMAMPLVQRNLEPRIQNNIRQYRPLLRAEYRVVVTVCRPTPEQRKQLARDAEKALREAARKSVVMFQRPVNVAERVALEPRRVIGEGLAASVKAHLPAEAAGRYREELARRDASRKRAAIRNIVAVLDQDLVLGHDQREKIEASLDEHWDESWCPSLQMFMNNNHLVPPIPDSYITPSLNDSQKTIWRGIPRFNGYFGGVETIGGIMLNDPLEDPDLRAARLEAEKNDPKPANQRGGPVMIFDARVLAPAVPAKAQAKPAAPAAGKHKSKQ